MLRYGLLDMFSKDALVRQTWLARVSTARFGDGID